jgi:hypothetical protein
MALKSDLDAVRKHFAASGGGDAGSVPWLKIKGAPRGSKTVVQLRIAGPWSKRAEGFFFYYLCLHYNFKIGGYPRAIPCLEANPQNPHSGNCPVCAFVGAIKNSENQELIKKLVDGKNNIRKAFNYYVNALERGKESEGWKVWRVSKRIITMIQEGAEDSDIGDVTDSQTGRDIVVTRVGTTFTDTRYSERFKIKPSKVSYQSKELNQLDKVVPNWIDADTMKQIMKDNYLEEMREVGYGIKKKKKTKLVTVDEDEEDVPVRKKNKKIMSKLKLIRNPVDDESEYDEEDYENIEDIDGDEEEE